MFSFTLNLQKSAVRTATVKFLKFLLRLKLGLFSVIIVISLSLMSTAAAATQDLKFSSPSGYIVKASFSYDEKNIKNYDKNQTSKIIREQGKGKTKMINSLQVSFYKPSGEMIASYDNIVDGVAQGNYFEFGFDPLTHQLAGNVDLGGESAGEIYLKGSAESGLSLIEVESTGEERVVDHLDLLARLSLDLNNR